MRAALQSGRISAEQCVAPAAGFPRGRFFVFQARPITPSSRAYTPTHRHRCSVDIRDVSGGCGAQFSVVVVSPAFESASRVQQQRMVNEALAPYVEGVHSITMSTMTPAQWKAKQEFR